MIILKNNSTYKNIFYLVQQNINMQINSDFYLDDIAENAFHYFGRTSLNKIKTFQDLIMFVNPSQFATLQKERLRIQIENNFCDALTVILLKEMEQKQIILLPKKIFKALYRNVKLSKYNKSIILQVDEDQYQHINWEKALTDIIFNRKSVVIKDLSGK